MVSKNLKGQVTFINFVVFFVTFLVVMVFMPEINSLISTTATTMLANNSNPQTQLSVTVMYLIPVVIVIGLILTFLNFSNPKREVY